MSNNQLTMYQDLAFGELTEQDIVTIRETIGKECNESQFKLFMAIAKSSGANPVHNEIYPAVRGGQLTIQFGIDYYVRKSKETDGYYGYDVQLVHENDVFKMHQEKDEDGRYFMVIDEHSFQFPRGKVAGGYVFAYREGFKPFTVIMDAEEVEHYKRSNIGMQKTMWNNNFNDMFKKHMVRRALKAAFNLNEEEEPIAHSAEPDGNESRERIDITPNTEESFQEFNEEDELSKTWDEINNKLKSAKKPKSFLTELIKEQFNKKPADLNLQQVTGLSRLIDLKINEKQPVNEELQFEFEPID